LQLSKAKFFIVEPELIDKTLSSVKGSGILESRIFVLDHGNSQCPPELSSWKRLLGHGERDWVIFDDEDITKKTTAALLSTSGTTGMPKAAEVSHYAHVAQSVQITHLNQKPYEVCFIFIIHVNEI